MGAETKYLMDVFWEEEVKQIKAILPPEEKPGMESGGGPGAGGFTMFPEEPERNMDGGSFRLALRRRIGVRGKRVLPSAAGAEEACQHRCRDGHMCGWGLDAGLIHAMTCSSGPYRVARHNRIRDFIARWLRVVADVPVLTEQFLPVWDIPAEGDRPLRRAKLDITGTLWGSRLR